jgi:leishmanolysin
MSIGNEFQELLSVGSGKQSIFLSIDSVLASPADMHAATPTGETGNSNHSDGASFGSANDSPSGEMNITPTDATFPAADYAPIISHVTVASAEQSGTYVVDQLEFQTPNFSLEGPEHRDSLNTADDRASSDSHSRQSGAADVVVGETENFHSESFASFTFDAKGGGGSHPGGGGGGGGHGGGGGGGLPTTYTTGDPNVNDANEFNITINFSGSNWTSQEQAIVKWAADLWSSVITGDVQDDTDLNGNPVDDIVITMSIGRIDGAGNPITGDVLAQTSIAAVRDPGSVDQWLPVTSTIELDSTDLSNSISSGWSGVWDTVILHEMGHALGFAGIIFDNLGLVDSAGNFIGTNAVAAYANGSSVPLEQNGGAGTAGSHWDEATFAPGGVLMSDELMTGWVDPNQPIVLSDTTVQAFADLGYQVTDPSASSPELVIDSKLLLA